MYKRQIIQSKIENGDFHITIKDITDEEAKLIAKRPDVKAAARYGVLNFKDDKGYTISDKKSIIVGADEEFVTQLQVCLLYTSQLRKMLYREGASISIKAVCIATVTGVICGRLFCYLANEVMAFKFIIFHFSILPILIFAVLLIGVQMLVSFCICKSVERDTLTERLRIE